MSSGYDRTYDNSYNTILKDPYNQDPYQDPNRFRQPNQFNQDQYQYNQYQPTNRAYEDINGHVGDYTPFYIVVTICTIIGFTLFILNITIGCCSKYSKYWNDRHTGNRWIVSLWTATPHKQPPLDYSTELKEISSRNQVVYYHPQEEENPEKTEFLEIRTKRESEI